MPQVTTHIRLCRTNSNQFLSGAGAGAKLKNLVWIDYLNTVGTRQVLESTSKLSMCWPHFNLFNASCAILKCFQLSVPLNFIFWQAFEEYFGAKNIVLKNELLLIVVKSEVKQISRVFFFKLHTFHLPFVVCHCVPQFWQLRIALSHTFSIVMEPFGVDAGLP